MIELGVLLMASGLLAFLGIWERHDHQDNVEKIPLRVNVNGIRGKSTATRLITAVLSHNGFRTVGKTTGTSARMIYPDQSEVPVKRRPQGPNIGEQRKVIQEAAAMEIDALVCECMAVNPDYQIIFQEKYLQAQIGVIVNVLEDHMDVMGPTLDEVAEAFLPTIPYDGFLITVPGPYLERYKEVARERNTKVIVAPVGEIPEDLMKRFEYVIFPENIAIAAAVGEAVGIARSQAYEAMLKATPDPGATRMYPYTGADGGDGFFVNGFAVNDADSTVKMWDRVAVGHYNTENPIYIMNCRPDRVDRTQQFAVDVLPVLPKGTVLAVGQSTRPIADAVRNGTIDCHNFYDLEERSTEDIVGIIDQHLDGQLIYGVGNIHGSGAPLVSHLTGVEWTG